MRVNGGKAGVWYDSGRGKIFCAREPRLGIESRLLADLERLVDDQGLSIVLSSIDTGQHAPRSRHYQGRAADTDEVHLYGNSPEPATLANPHAVAAVEWLIDHGYHPAHENGPYDAVLFGPVRTRWNATDVPHDGHIHASIHR